MVLRPAVEHLDGDMFSAAAVAMGTRPLQPAEVPKVPLFAALVHESQSAKAVIDYRGSDPELIWSRN